MTEGSKKQQVTVVGGGPGGYAAAFLAADMEMDVTLIDPEVNPGGVCTYRGCIPSKALLHLAKLVQETRHAGDWGLTYAEPKVDLAKMRSWKEDVVKQNTGGLGQLVKHRKINYIQGTARFTSNTTLEIVTGSEMGRKLSFEHAIIATGSYPARIPNLPVDSDRLLDSTTALDLVDIPGKLLVVGGGYIGLELGSVYAALGSEVSLVEMTGGLLPGVDVDLVRVLHKQIEGLFHDLHFNTKAAEIKVQKNGVKVTFEGKDADGTSKLYDRVLIAIGRRPNSAELGLENTGVKVDQRGFVQVDAQRRTTQERIWAIGDVVGEPMLAHKATHEGRLVVEVIAGSKAVFEPYAIPAVVFTDPEIAWAGLTEAEARRTQRNIEAVRYPWVASGRARTLGRTDGVTKLIIEQETERLLGIGIAGPGAGELVAEGVLAIEMGATAKDIGLTIHAHPTLSETIMEAADTFYGTSAHYYRRRK